MFVIKTPKKRFDANKIKFGGLYPYVVRTSINNGIRGYITENTDFLNEKNTISFGQDTATMFYQKSEYFTGDKIKVFKLKDYELNSKIANFLISVMTKAFSNFSWGSSSFNVKVLNEVKIILPLNKNGEIDFDFMESFIAELEAERVRELEAYLKASGLSDTTLSPDEKSALNTWNSRIWQEFRIGDLFEKLSAKFLGKGDKFKAVSKIKTTEFFVPIVYCKFGDNGIMYWAKKNDFKTYKNVISIVYNGAIAAGKVYAQPHETGILAESYFIKFKNCEIDFKVNLFFQCVLEKILYPKYSRDYLATWDNKVENDVISLPITQNGEIDFDFMESFIKAIQKECIKGVDSYFSKNIATTKAVINN